MIVKEEDCGTSEGVTVEAFIDDKDGTVIEGLITFLLVYLPLYISVSVLFAD